jgi:hypothetical protein
MSGGKKKRTGRSASAKRAPAPAAPAPEPIGTREALEALGLGLGGALGYFLLSGYSTLLPILTVPLIIGVAVALCTRKASAAAVIAAGAGFVGGLLSLWAYPLDRLAVYLNSMPAYANPDIPGSVYQNFIIPLMRANILNTSMTGSGGAVVVVLLATLLTMVVAFAVSALESARPKAGRFETAQLLGLAAALLIVASFMVTTWEETPELRASLAVEPVDESYAFDPIINLRAYYLMLKGDDYYTAIVRAALGDSRLAVGTHFTQDGKFSAGWGSNIPLREPWMWYLWKVIAPAGGGGILWWAMMAAGGFLLASYLALLPWISHRALLAVAAVYPVMMMHTVWVNVLHPDWWGTLALLFSMLALLRRWFVAAGVFALAAALFRELLVIWLIMLLVVATYRVLRSKEKEWLRGAVAMLVLLVLFVVLYTLHWNKTLTLVDSKAPLHGGADGTGPTGIVYVLRSVILPRQNPIEHRLMQPTSYLMYPYGSFRFPNWILMPLGALGLWMGLRRDKPIALLIAGYVFFWFSYYLIIGPTLSYWGQMVMPLAVLGTGILATQLHAFVRDSAEDKPKKAAAA